MTDQNSRTPDDLPEATIKSHRISRGASVIWLIPLAAAVIGGVIGYQIYSTRGAQIQISFPNAEGLESGKTSIRYLNVVIGTVSDIVVAPDMKTVLVTAEMTEESSQHLVDGTRFWVVRPRIGGGRVTGLGTLFSGSYIAMSPGPIGGKRQRQFVGLTEQPVKPFGDGMNIVIDATRLHGLAIGAPIYYLDIKVGEITTADVNEAGTGVIMNALIDHQHAHYVRQNSRFWNVSGIDITANALEGLRVDIESLSALVSGGLSFYTPGKAGPPAEDGARFKVRRHGPSTSEGAHRYLGPRFVIEASKLGSVKAGDPVYYRGEQVGQVISQMLHDDAASIGIQVEIAHRYAALIREKTVFWNASGFSADLGLTGIHVHSESLQALLAGGIALAVPNKPGNRAAEGSVFKLRTKAPRGWEKWRPQISLSGKDPQPNDSSGAGKQDPEPEKLIHHKGEEAGEKKKSKHWYRRLF